MSKIRNLTKRIAAAGLAVLFACTSIPTPVMAAEADTGKTKEFVFAGIDAEEGIKPGTDIDVLKDVSVKYGDEDAEISVTDIKAKEDGKDAESIFEDGMSVIKSCLPSTTYTAFYSAKYMDGTTEVTANAKKTFSVDAVEVAKVEAEAENSNDASKTPEKVAEEDVSEDDIMLLGDPASDAKITKFIQQPDFSYRIRALAGDCTFDPSASLDVKNAAIKPNSNIKAIKWTSTKPSEDHQKEGNVLSASGSEPIYGWFDNGTLYLWSESGKALLPNKSSAMFAYLTALYSFDGAGFDASAAETMMMMFAYDSSLTSVDISTWTGENVTTLTALFAGNTKLETIDMSAFDCQNVKDMTYCFSTITNRSLKSITLGDKWAFKTPTALSDNWKNMNNNKIYSAPAIEQKWKDGAADQAIPATYVRTNETADITIADEQFHINGLDVNNGYEIHDPSAKFTGYCIEHNMGNPTGYYEKEKATDANIDDLLRGNSNPGTMADSMTKALITLIYYGYPNDPDGMAKANNLSASDFRTATQYAIWHFTDSDFDARAALSALTGLANKDGVLATYDALIAKKYIPNFDGFSLYLYKSVSEHTYENAETGKEETSTFQNVLAMEGMLTDTYGGVQILKTDDSKKPLADAVFTIYKEDGTTKVTDITTGNDGVAGIWNTDEQHGLIKGTYVIKETKAPEGYELSADTYTFTITDDDNQQIITKGKQNNEGDAVDMVFVDKALNHVQIAKYDNFDRPLAGAELQVFHMEGDKEVIDATWTSTSKAHPLTLTKGSYTLRETKVPAGYEAIKDVAFEVNDEGKIVINGVAGNQISAHDQYKVFSIPFMKKDNTGMFVSGAEITVTGKIFDGTAIKPMTIKTEGNIQYSVQLFAGTYTFSETVTPNGYETADPIIVEIDKEGNAKINGTQIKDVTMIDNIKTYDVTVKKTDVGGAEIAGAKLTVTHVEGEETKTDDSWTSEAGKDHIVKGLKEGIEYTLTETKAPDGYATAESITFTINADGKPVIDQKAEDAVVMVDKEALHDVTVKKTDIAGEEIAGAQLTVTHKEGEETKTDDTWTSEAGKDHVVKGLKEGIEYTLTETKAPDGYATAESITFTINADGKPVVDQKAEDAVVMVDKEALHDVTVKKTDVAGAEIAGAKLTVTHVEGEETKTDDSWTSEAGKDHIVKGLKEGIEYTLTETKAPDGYVTAESISFTINADGQPVIAGKAEDAVVMVDKEALHDVTVKKTDIAGAEIAGAQLTVTHKEGEEVKTDDSWTSEAGKDHIVKGLSAGVTYTLTETKAPEGYATAESIDFIINAEGKPVIKNNAVDAVVMLDAESVHDVTVKKTDVAGKEIAGAKLTVTHKEGDIVKTDDSWTSEEGKDHVVKGLMQDVTYTLTETTSPAGYLKAESITFTVNADGKAVVDNKAEDAVIMVDKLSPKHDVTVKKTDVAGKEIEGAKLTVSHMENNEVVIDDTWTSVADQDHIVKGLVEDTVYTLKEETAPEGFAKAENISFTINNEGKPVIKNSAEEAVVMVDKPETTSRVLFKKTDKDSQLIGGAVIVISHKENDKVVQDVSWTSAKGKIHVVNGLSRNVVYTMTEKTAPTGYKIADPIEFTINDDNEVMINNKKVTNNIIIMVDEAKEETPTSGKTVKIDKTDINGKELPGAKLEVTKKDGTSVESWTSTSTTHEITLEPGTYVLHESGAPDGYVKASDIEFKVDENGKVTVASKDVSKVTMVDDFTKASFSKVDDANKALSGAKLEIKESSNGIVIDSWTSNGSVHTVTGKLKVGTTYVLHESEAPSGYDKAADIAFRIDDTGKIVSPSLKNGVVTMVDKKINTKQPDLEKGNLSITKFVAGNGGSVSKKFEFMVTLTQNDGTPLTGSYKYKAGKNSGTLKLSDSGQVKVRVSHNQTAVIYDLPVGVSYQVVENDYSKDGYVSEAGNAKGTISKAGELVTYTNTRNVTTTSRRTGDASQMPLWIGLGAAGIAAIAVVVRKKKKK